MSENDRIIGNLQKGMDSLEENVAEIRADVKKLLAAHNHSRGIMYMISAFISGITGMFTGLVN